MKPEQPAAACTVHPPCECDHGSTYNLQKNLHKLTQKFDYAMERSNVQVERLAKLETRMRLTQDQVARTVGVQNAYPGKVVYDGHGRAFAMRPVPINAVLVPVLQVKPVLLVEPVLRVEPVLLVEPVLQGRVLRRVANVE